MYAVIDPSSPREHTLYYWTDKSPWQRRIFFRQAVQNLTLALATIGQELLPGASTMQGIGVVVGQGSFTATRLAATLANALAFALQIPVVAGSGTKEAEWRERFANPPLQRYILPAYSGPPVRLGSARRPGAG